MDSQDCVVNIDDDPEEEGAPLIDGDSLDMETPDDPEEARYKKACLVQLYMARLWAITEEARESLMIMTLMSGAVVGVNMILPSDSMGGGALRI